MGYQKGCKLAPLPEIPFRHVTPIWPQRSSDSSRAKPKLQIRNIRRGYNPLVKTEVWLADTKEGHVEYIAVLSKKLAQTVLEDGKVDVSHIWVTFPNNQTAHVLCCADEHERFSRTLKKAGADQVFDQLT